MRNSSRLLLCLSVLGVLAACGQAGDLYLPDKQPAQPVGESLGGVPAATDPSEAPGEETEEEVEEEAEEENVEEQEEAEEPSATSVPGATQP